MRCFVAVWPPTEVVETLASLRRPSVDSVRWTTRDQWHVTLRFFGELTPPEVARACDALQQVASCLPTNLVARGGPATRFLGPGLVVWPVEGLAAPAGAVEQATALLGQPPASRRFLGHLTIARGARGTDLRVERQLLAPLTGSWAVTSLSLVASELNVGGARYTEAAAFRVGPASLG